MEERKEPCLLPQELASPWGLEKCPAGWRQEEGTGKLCLSSASRWTSLGTFAEFSPLLPHLFLHCLPHKRYSASVPYLSESLEKTIKLKSFTKHGHWTLLTRYWIWANIRLINSTQHALKVTGFSWSSVRRSFLHENLFNNLISNVLITYQFSSVQSRSRVWLFATPWIGAHQASMPITNSRSSLKLMSIELVMPSSHLILCCPLLLLPPIPPSIRVFSNESTLRIRWPKYWSFSFSIIPSKEHPGLISFRMDRLDLLAVQGTLKSLLQHHSSKASILQHSAFFTVQLSHPYMTTGKTIALTRGTFVGKVIPYDWI